MQRNIAFVEVHNEPDASLFPREKGQEAPPGGDRFSAGGPPRHPGQRRLLQPQPGDRARQRPGLRPAHLRGGTVLVGTVRPDDLAQGIRPGPSAKAEGLGPAAQGPIVPYAEFVKPARKTCGSSGGASTGCTTTWTTSGSTAGSWRSTRGARRIEAACRQDLRGRRPRGPAAADSGGVRRGRLLLSAAGIEVRASPAGNEHVRAAGRSGHRAWLLGHDADDVLRSGTPIWDNVPLAAGHQRPVSVGTTAGLNRVARRCTELISNAGRTGEHSDVDEPESPANS